MGKTVTYYRKRGKEIDFLIPNEKTAVERTRRRQLGNSLTGGRLQNLAYFAGSGTTAQGSWEIAPDFSGVTLDGREVSLSEYRGKPLVLAFMASW